MIQGEFCVKTVSDRENKKLSTFAKEEESCEKTVEEISGEIKTRNEKKKKSGAERKRLKKCFSS